MRKWIFKAFFPAFEKEDSKLAVNWLTQFKIALDILINGIIFILLTVMVFYVDPFASMFSEFSVQEHQGFVENLIFGNLSKWPLIFPLLFLTFLINLLMANRIILPIVAIQRRFKKYLRKDEEKKIGSDGRDYFHQVSSMVDQLQASLNRDMLFLKDEMARIESMLREGSITNPEAAAKLEEALSKIQIRFDLKNVSSEDA